MSTLRPVASEFVFETPAPFAQCHASTLEALEDGRIVCAWFGGTEEGADDVAIWLSIRDASGWSAPRMVASDPRFPAWNPVLFAPRSADQPSGLTRGELLLFYRIGPNPREWWSYVMKSSDGGESWSEPAPLPAGLLGPIKNKPIALADGTWLAPSSVETGTEWFAVIERSGDQGATWTPSDRLIVPGHPRGIIQPTLWESEPGHVHALMRSRGIGRIVRSDSSDGGRTWSEPRITDHPNNNSGIDAVKVHALARDGRKPPIAMVWNPVTQGRTPLVLSLSYDNGESWETLAVLEDEPGEFSYPAVISLPDGIALTYTWKRERIRFHRFAVAS